MIVNDPFYEYTLYSATCCYVPIYCKRSLDKNERNIEKKKIENINTSKTYTFTLIVTSPYGTRNRKVDETRKNQQLP